MSDPVTNAEVEDVLSSIRRLVSEEKRPALRRVTPQSDVGKDVSPVPEAAKESPDRLVLTPALRVAETEPRPAAATEDAEPDSNGMPAADTDGWDEDEDQLWMSAEADKFVMEDRIDWSVSDDEDDHEPIAADDLESSVSADPPTATASENVSSETADGRSADISVTDDPAMHGHDTVAQDDAVVADVAQTTEPETERGPETEAEQTASETSVADLSSDAFAPKLDDYQSDAPVESGTDSAEPSTDRNVTMSERTATLSAKIAALETVISRNQDHWTPDAQDADEYSGSDPAPIDWQDDVDLDGKGIPFRASRARAAAEAAEAAEALSAAQEAAKRDQQAKAEKQPFDMGDDDQFLDEEMLRDLVSEIVRSELQGALGERITRNVRKLVRREIHRALTAQELE